MSLAWIVTATGFMRAGGSGGPISAFTWPVPETQATLRKLTTTDPTLRELVDHILAATQPERIILFGSRVRGQEGPRSDFDVLVIQDSREPRYKRAGLIYRALAAFPAEVDVVVYTPSEVEEWRGVPEAFVTTAVQEGITLYAREG